MSKSDPFEMIAKRNQVLIESLTKSLSPAIEAAQKISNYHLENLNKYLQNSLDPLLHTSEAIEIFRRNNSALIKAIKVNSESVEKSFSQMISSDISEPLKDFQATVNETLSVFPPEVFPNRLSDNVDNNRNDDRPEESLEETSSLAIFDYDLACNPRNKIITKMHLYYYLSYIFQVIIELINHLSSQNPYVVILLLPLLNLVFDALKEWVFGSDNKFID